MRALAPLCALLLAAPAHADDPDGSDRVALVDMRPVLTQLAMAAGANDHLTLLRAQSEDRPQAIVISGGDVTLDDFAAADLPPEALRVSDREVTAMVPIVVWTGAALTLDTGDDLRLTRESGAFLLNFGTLTIQGAVVSGVGRPNPNAAEFRPFVLSAGTGEIVVTDARLEGLGFGRNRNFGGVSSVSRGLFRSDEPAVITGTAFRDVTAVNIDSTIDAEFTGNKLFGGTNGIQVTDTTGTRVADNFFAGMDKHAIVLRGENEAVTVTRNEIAKIGGIGIFANGAGRALSLVDNTVTDAGAGGVTLVGVACAEVSGNTISQAGQKGLSLRRTGTVTLSGNRLHRNGGAGIHLAEQGTGAVTVLSGNVFVRNRLGLQGGGTETVFMDGNDFTDQFPRLVGGDMSRAIRLIGGDVRGDVPVQITATEMGPSDLHRPTCDQAEAL